MIPGSSGVSNFCGATLCLAVFQSASGQNNESPAPTLQDAVCPPWCGTAGSTQLPGPFLGVMDLGDLGFRISGTGCLSWRGDSCSMCGATEYISSHNILCFVKLPLSCKSCLRQASFAIPAAVYLLMNVPGLSQDAEFQYRLLGN